MAFEKMLQPLCVVAKMPMNRLLSCLGDRYPYLLDAATTGPPAFPLRLSSVPGQVVGRSRIDTLHSPERQVTQRA